MHSPNWNHSFSESRWKGSHISAAAIGFSGRTPELLFKDQVSYVQSVLCILHTPSIQVALSHMLICSEACQLSGTENGFWIKTFGGRAEINAEEPMLCQASSNLGATLKIGILVPICQMRKLNFRKIMTLALGCELAKWWNQDLSPELPQDTSCFCS